MDGLLDAYSALDARMKIVDIITNNLANSQTTGFKRDFGYILEGEKSNEVGSQVDVSEGDLVSTSNPLDAAIDGPGFFEVQTPNGIRYTRNGSFTANSKGELVTKEGFPVLSSSDTPITLTQGIAAIQDGGAVTVNGSEAGTLKIVSLPDPKKIQKESQTLMNWTGDPTEVNAVPEPSVKAGYLEHSNVNPVIEMVHLTSTFREYEAIQRTVKTLATDMNGKLVEESGRLS